VTPKKAPTARSHNPIKIVAKLQEPFAFLLHHGQRNFQHQQGLSKV
jgi:hypothetical protein